MKGTTIYCHSCGCSLEEELIHYVDGDPYCALCLDELTVFCHECGRRILRSENASEDDGWALCRSCFEDYYTNCDGCGRVILRNDDYYDEDRDEYLCDSCVRKTAIHNYSYKPAPIFYGEGPLFMGVELELDDGSGDNSDARDLLEIGNAEDNHIYIKYDGSLDNGFEIVTHPMTLEYHMKTMPWKAVMEEALYMGYRSHKSRTCGLHCHVNRTFFGETYAEQEANIAKVLFMVEKYWEELLRFSRRTQWQMDRWAGRYGFKEKPQQILDQAKKYSLGRYACINLGNSSTIEFRMWRGTLKYNTLIATLQMVDLLCRTALHNSEQALQDLSWWRFVSNIHAPELITYLKERQLYINEPVETDEEE